MIIDRFDDGAFAQESFIEPRDELVAHVFAPFGNDLQVLGKQGLKQRLGQVTFVDEELAPQPFGQLADRDARSQGTHGIARCETTVE